MLGGLLRQVRPLVHRDMTWDYVEVLAWTSLDLALGIVTASLPVLDGMLSNAWHRAMTSIGVSSHATGKNSTPCGQGPGSNASGRITPGIHASSESKEHIIGEADETEMGIVRTRVVHVQSSSKSSLDGYDFGIGRHSKHAAIS